ncbi:MAG: septal ring lytic transglycosylase RlpA family protein [Luminiphilus sp.]|nr:septal ring lytic transglycosylase RlpA family protein [Luminiphilus sp.]
MANRLRVVIAAILLLLKGCTLTTEVVDRAPPPISPGAVPDAIPIAEPVTRAGNSSPYTVNGQTYTVLNSAENYSEEGIASWYGLKFHGRATANGERFSAYEPTAAHRSLPIPSYVRVTNLENQASMILRVNDRGPFHPDRIIDLSYGAAVRLGFADQGTAKVRIDTVEVMGVSDLRDNPATEYRTLQLGAYESEAAAQALAEESQRSVAVPARVLPATTASGLIFRVRVGPFESQTALREAQNQLRAAGLPQGQPLP